MNLTDITTKDMIKVLPFDEKFKLELLDLYDIFTPDQRFELEQVIENAYFAIYKIKLQENINIAMMQADKGERELDGDFYRKVREQTEREMESDLAKSVQAVDLTAARIALEKIIQELKDARNAKKH